VASLVDQVGFVQALPDEEPLEPSEVPPSLLEPLPEDDPLDPLDPLDEPETPEEPPDTDPPPLLEPFPEEEPVAPDEEPLEVVPLPDVDPPDAPVLPLEVDWLDPREGSGPPFELPQPAPMPRTARPSTVGIKRDVMEPRSGRVGASAKTSRHRYAPMQAFATPGAG
jgi:periplasmic protein TonB